MMSVRRKSITTTVTVLAFVSVIAMLGAAQPPMSALVEALRPALPYPDGDEAGMQPAGGGDVHKWFVVWPTPDDDRVIVRANPLHPETQKTVSAAEALIQRAVAAAERRAQAAYDRALEELRRTGKGTNIDGITLDDEGAAGQRIDAELELTIALLPLKPFEVSSGEPPVTRVGTGGPAWIVRVPANEYQRGEGAERRAVFQPAEAHALFGQIPRPDVNRMGSQPRHAVTWPADASGFSVVLRGNEALLERVLEMADWSRLTAR